MESEEYILYQEGRNAMEKGDFATAAEMLKRSAETTPHFKTYECIGECLLEEGKFREAVFYLSAAAGLGNKSFRSYYFLAKALLELGNLELAKIKLNQALSIKPDYRSAKDLLNKISD